MNTNPYPRVYLAQLLCPLRHCVFAGAGRCESDQDVEDLRRNVMAQFTALVEGKMLNRKCDICESTSLAVDVGATRWDTLAEAQPGLLRLQVLQAAAHEVIMENKKASRN